MSHSVDGGGYVDDISASAVRFGQCILENPELSSIHGTMPAKIRLLSNNQLQIFLEKMLSYYELSLSFNVALGYATNFANDESQENTVLVIDLIGSKIILNALKKSLPDLPIYYKIIAKWEKDLDEWPADRAIDTIFVTRDVARSLSKSLYLTRIEKVRDLFEETEVDTKTQLEIFKILREEAFRIYGRVAGKKRIAEFVRENMLWFTILYFFGTTDLFGPRGLMWNVISGVWRFAVALAYAQAVVSGSPSTRQEIFSYVLLVLFVCMVAVTVRDEFFSKKPKPVSRDLNRAFAGFLLAQLGKLMGS